MACKVQLGGTAEKPTAMVQLASSDATASSWAPVGKFELPVGLDDSGQLKAEGFGDALAGGLLDRLVKVSVKKGAASTGLIPAAPKTVGAYVIRIENYSPLLLNGLAVSGMKAKAGDPVKLLLGISLSPRRTFVVPVTAESVERSGLEGHQARRHRPLRTLSLPKARPSGNRSITASVPLRDGGRFHFERLDL